MLGFGGIKDGDVGTVNVKLAKYYIWQLETGCRSVDPKKI